MIRLCGKETRQKWCWYMGVEPKIGVVKPHQIIHYKPYINHPFWVEKPLIFGSTPKLMRVIWGWHRGGHTLFLSGIHRLVVSFVQRRCYLVSEKNRSPMQDGNWNVHRIYQSRISCGIKFALTFCLHLCLAQNGSTISLCCRLNFAHICIFQYYLFIQFILLKQYIKHMCTH